MKHDGFRAIAYIENRECRLVSRNLNHLVFDSLKQALAKLRVKNAILDGEIVVIDEHGVSQCNQLLRREGDPVFYAFDLLWLNGKDYRSLPLVERKQRLEHLIKSSKSAYILFAQHIDQYRKQFFKETVPDSNRSSVTAHGGSTKTAV